MKRILIAILMSLIFTGFAWADWSVTITWTPSPGPDLSVEKVFLDGNEKCSVDVGNPASCNFVVTDLIGQEVSIVSYNSQNTASAPYKVGNLLAVPSPASGGLITITIVP